jgi:hypothetical protein
MFSGGFFSFSIKLIYFFTNCQIYNNTTQDKMTTMKMVEGDLEQIIASTKESELHLPEDIICAQISSPYLKTAHTRIENFLQDPDVRYLTYGYSSGGARAHMLYRSDKGHIFAVYKSIDRPPRAYYLSNWFLRDIFGETAPKFDDPFEKEVEVDDPFEKKVEVDDPFEKEVEVDDPFEKKVEVDDPFEKEVEVDDPFEKVDIPLRANL